MKTHRTEHRTENRAESWENWLPRIAEAGLSGDRQRLEVILVDVIRSLKRSNSAVSKELGQILATYATNPGSLRWKETGPPPVDGDEGLALVRILEGDAAPCPILPLEVTERVNQFICERRGAAGLLKEGFTPPCSLLLTGLPGTGKSMLARWLAAELNLPLVVQDLATSISSLLGKTGFNLRRTLDYARNRPCVLLLDEFDALAKRRDDQSEVGELKRIVNVLLKELEEWPLHSVLVAATNHQALLDPAIRRRFHVVLDLPLPGEPERQQILARTAGQFGEALPQGLLAACGTALDGWTGSDLEAAMRAAVRKHLVGDVPLVRSLLNEVCRQTDGNLQGKSVGPLVRAIQHGSGDEFTVRELAEFFDKSASTIQHHLKKEAVDA
jgi:SpoVK/Ycf46/Vps4 family AAA+-type ATPase